MELRPLGFGEIFDRAITLYVRNFIPFVGIVSVMIVPLAVLQYFVDVASIPQWDILVRQISHPGTTSSPPTVPLFFTSPVAATAFVLLLVVALFVWPFALNACTVGIARLYRGKPVEFGPCYEASLRRWPQVFGLVLVEIGLFIVWYVAFVLFFAFALFIAILILRISEVLGVLAIVAAVILMLASLLTIAPIVVAFSFAMNSIVIEELPVFASIGLGFARVFNRREFWRAVVFALAAVAIVLGASTLISAVVMLALVLHWVVVEVVLSSLFRAAVAPFSIVLFAIYYFDVRIRREGYEIEAGLDRLTGVPQPA